MLKNFQLLIGNVLFAKKMMERIVGILLFLLKKNHGDRNFMFHVDSNYSCYICAKHYDYYGPKGL